MLEICEPRLCPAAAEALAAEVGRAVDASQPTADVLSPSAALTAAGTAAAQATAVGAGSSRQSPPAAFWNRPLAAPSWNSTASLPPAEADGWNEASAHSVPPSATSARCVEPERTAPTALRGMCRPSA